MKAELVADSVEANPFPCKATKPKKKPNAVAKKKIAAVHQSIHFLPAHQFVRQTSRAFPAIIPVLGGKKTNLKNPVGKGLPEGSSRQPPLSARMKSEDEEKTRRAKKTKADK